MTRKLKTLFFAAIFAGASIMNMNAEETILKDGSLFATSQKTGLEYVLAYTPDRMLSPAYTALGKTPKAATYGGWESRQIQGHMLGHYLSALSGFYFQTKSKEAKEKLDYTVKCIKEIQREDGYFGGIPSTPFDNVFSSGGSFNVDRFSLADYWVPWYSLHKIFAGLIDSYTFGKNEDALGIVTKMADWAIAGTKKDERRGNAEDANLRAWRNVQSFRGFVRNHEGREIPERSGKMDSQRDNRACDEEAGQASGIPREHADSEIHRNRASLRAYGKKRIQNRG